MIGKPNINLRNHILHVPAMPEELDKLKELFAEGWTIVLHDPVFRHKTEEHVIYILLQFVK